jgi:hypothetical protein
MIRNTKKGRTPFKSKRHGKTRRVQRGGVRIPIPIPINDEHGNQIGTYDGKTKKGRAVYPEPIGGVYVGEFENGVPHGQGTMTYNDGGGVYTGQWENDRFHGKGKMIYHNGDVYEGEWAGNNMNGPGIMTYKDIGVYDGYWKDDQRNGPGAMTYTNGDVYVGNWDNNAKNGTGTYTFANGDVYEGEWNANFMHGLGKMTYANGDVYEGEWNANFMHGLGKMTYANGDVSEGPWFKDVKVDYNVSIARTTDEFMSMCLTAEKTESECMDSVCPICLTPFIFEDRLLRPVMFHETTNATGRKIWSCPVHTEEQLKYKHNCITSFSHTECINCRANLFLTKEQRDDVAATKMQRMIRERLVRRRTRKKVRQAKNLAAFNAEFPPSRSISRPRSMSIPRAMSMTRTNRNNSDL